MEIDSVLKGVCIPSTVFGVPDVEGFLQVIPNAVTPTECEAIIQLAEQKGFARASLYTDKTGVEHYSEIRKSDRCIIDSKPFAEALWKRLVPYIPKHLADGWEAKGMNERLRLLRYRQGDEFLPHSDGTYYSPDGLQSKITILLYLNAGYKGGYTHFLTQKGEWSGIQPEIGMVTMQDQGLMHCVPPLEEGTKYVLRTEVMYGFPVDTSKVKVIKIVE